MPFLMPHSILADPSHEQEAAAWCPCMLHPYTPRPLSH
jgi:hypothetical protein